MMPKICISMAFICFTLLVLPNSSEARRDSDSRYLLVELDGSPDVGPGMDDTTFAPMPEPEEDDLEPEPFPEEDEEDVMPEEEEEPARRRSLKHNAAGGGYRSSN